ncbi:universal stress protein [Beijerinckia sp. L45]|uniref:universal stress protein n=1 Tax=Beijerinckia sp. L45 TaxID=1641855 RepID=UPI00131E4402|nr:universal stress protein [Beijerinckia sp. L45]
MAERLDSRLARSGGTGEVRRIDAWPSAIPDLAVSQARFADLFVATTPYRDVESVFANRLTEAVLFEAGHGLLLVPPLCPVRPHLVNVLVAWTDTTLAIRAVTEAMPFLSRATQVRLLTISTGGREAGAETSADIAAHLCRHGANVEIEALKGEDHQIGYMICEAAAKFSADLIVMGGYGHSRFREWVLGGATRDVIQRSTVPLLVAH